MGSGIAMVSLASGLSVVLLEADQSRVEAAVRRVEHLIDRARQHNTAGPDSTSLQSRLRATIDPGELCRAGVVIESVPESLELKRSVLATIEAHVAPSTVIASNTSSLSIEELARDMADATRFVGMHFFNPVPASSLIELVTGSATDNETLQSVALLALRLEKETITVSDSPGFATSRLGVLLGLEAMRMVEEKVASVADIDRAMVLGYRHPMGPLRLGDLVGLDVRLAIAQYLESRLGERFAPPEILISMVAANELGKKTGQGFYSWPS
jgi:3-hydroxybutyryl-CoA dehydrogenase